MTILTVDHPRGHPPFCASVVVDYWRRRGATVEAREVRDDG